MTLQQHDRGVCKNLLMNFFMKFFSLKFCFQSIFYKKIIFFIKKNFGPHFPISCSHLFQDSFNTVVFLIFINFATRNIFKFSNRLDSAVIFKIFQRYWVTAERGGEVTVKRVHHAGSTKIGCTLITRD